MRTIKVYEETVTEESLQQAESICTDEIEITVTVDDLDIEDHDGSESKAIAYAAVKAIREYGSVEPSCSGNWRCGLWYTTIDPDRNYSNGDESRYSLHLDDFTEEEQRIIHNLIA